MKGKSMGDILIDAFVKGHKAYDKLTKQEREPWEERAKDIVFPDLRTGYQLQDQMISTIARGLYRAYILSQFGDKPEQISHVSMLDPVEDPMRAPRFNVEKRR